MNTNISLYPIIIFLIGERSCQEKDVGNMSCRKNILSEIRHVSKMSFRKYVLSRKGEVENMVCRGKILSTKNAVGETFCQRYSVGKMSWRGTNFRGIKQQPLHARKKSVPGSWRRKIL